MFQDALMESGGKITTKSRYFSILGIVINGSILSALILWPLLHPLALPKQALTMLLVAPSPPVAPAPVSRAAATPAARVETLTTELREPSRIPNSISTVAEAAPPTNDSGMAVGEMPGAGSNSAIGDLFKGTGTPIRPAVQVAVPRKVAISSGVMAGNKISGENPAYPAIAREARIQGTVVIAATISKIGSIENLRVVNGPPLLAAGAVSAVRTWRYKPYLLNGLPVEVETTINVVFNLGN
jgi:protein TonB